MPSPLQGARALLFDLDGVLIDSYDVWLRLMNAVAQELGYPEISAEEFAGIWGQGTEADVARFYTRHTSAQVQRRYDALFPRFAPHLRVEEGVGDVFAGLAARGIPSAVVTNTPNPTAAALVELAGARPDLVVGGTDVPRAKPAPDMVLLACERLGVEARNAWLVGDSRFDAEAARAAGAGFVGFRRDGDLRVDDLRELAGWLGPEAER